MWRRLEIAGKRFGLLVAIEAVGRQRGAIVWKMRCDCGREIRRAARDLKSVAVPSCGCRIGRRIHTNARRSQAQREALFWSHVDMSGGPHACWPWTAAASRNGYGCFGYDIDGVHFTHTASRFALSLAEPQPAAGLLALHHCDNRPCCNPLHLYWGTDRDNAADRSRRGRDGGALRRGSANHLFIDLTGCVFGRLTVIALAGSMYAKGTTWRCVCTCGRECVKRSATLMRGDSKSCGVCWVEKLSDQRMKDARGYLHMFEAPDLSAAVSVRP